MQVIGILGHRDAHLDRVLQRSAHKFVIGARNATRRFVLAGDLPCACSSPLVGRAARFVGRGRLARVLQLELSRVALLRRRVRCRSKPGPDHRG